MLTYLQSSFVTIEWTATRCPTALSSLLTRPVPGPRAESDRASCSPSVATELEASGWAPASPFFMAGCTPGPCTLSIWSMPNVYIRNCSRSGAGIGTSTAPKRAAAAAEGGGAAAAARRAAAAGGGGDDGGGSGRDGEICAVGVAPLRGGPLGAGAVARGSERRRASAK